MVPGMDEPIIRTVSRGVNQSGVRDHNVRLLLTLLQRHGPMAGSDLARLANLSPQTVSIIMREMEGEGLLARGIPVKGKVGKPSVPMRLAEGGVLSLGCKIGRRSVVLLLADFRGTVRQELRLTYNYPMPGPIFAFLREGIEAILAQCSPAERSRICGIGIGTRDNQRWDTGNIGSQSGRNQLLYRFLGGNQHFTTHVTAFFHRS